MNKKLIDNEIFYCESLLANDENLRIIQKFHVATETGLGLEMYLKQYAASVRICIVYIFALPYRPLIKYYETLNFKRLGKTEEAFIHRNYKPRYDGGCIFMSRPLYAAGSSFAG